MRTKTAILTAAFVAAGALSSMAQSNVYSLNVVGYVNVQLTNGFNIVANPLDLDGTGTNNTIVGVFSNSLPNGVQIFKFTGGGFNTSLGWNHNFWSGNASFNPGEAIFLSVPVATNFTFVGQVLQGSQTNNYISPSGGYSLISSVIPLSGGVQTTLGFTPTPLTQVFLYGSVAGYSSYGFNHGFWSPSEPVLSPGQGMFINTTQTSWVETFTVQ
jgi:hypothetical protein